ncbi:hypothetical protein ACEPAF_5747 [Sanghuangporus sanghuang]
MLEDVTLPAIFKLIPPLRPGSAYHLSEPSAVYVRSTREKLFGKKLEELAPPGPARDAAWEEVKKRLDKLAEFYDKNGEDKVFYLTDTFSLADAIVIAALV